jgi:uncharacterized protein YndB with AHSA1/START domain
MKIEKDVIISKSIDPVWKYLISEKRFMACLESDREAFSRNREHEKPSACEILEITPPTKFSIKLLQSGVPLVTTMELSPKGKRTGMKVIVTGWDKVSHDKAKAEMPRMSLQWETRLGNMKREIESLDG